ncbi:zinc finger RNA-binding protein-like isoform X2 [Convolutriloba macropyga]|uniref:zinc finger RNA-binding protein-like isoform X2 n=1 Tax=Convolutriloba macropyga TaxID=536237 RepID=UPI003F528E89
MSAYYNSQGRNQPAKMKEPAKTVMVPNFSAFNSSAATSSSSSSSSNRHQGDSGRRSPPSHSRRNDDRHYSSRSSYSSRDRDRDRGGRSEPRWKQQTKYYCDICCVNCAGEQSYEAHMAGQPHMKRARNAAIQQKEKETGTSTGTSSNKQPPENFCEVCNVACSSPEAYTAHIRGQKHQKTIKLWSSLGKPIPESLKPQVVKVIPKTNFTVGGTLNTLTGKMEPTSDRPQTSNEPIIPVATPPVREEKPIIGRECIVEEKDKHGKVVNFKCTICDCDMNNKYMRDDHLKGRKHLTEYKLKVNPHLKVADKKLSQAFQQIEQIRIQAEQQEMIRREHREQGMRNKISQRERELLAQYPGCVQTSSVPSVNDNVIFRKHCDICPTPDEIQWADKFLAVIESALKLVSESLCKDTGSSEKDLKAVMRIGCFAKGISLKDEKDFELVVLCSKKPDQKLIMSIHTLVSEKIPEVNIFQNEEFEVTLRIKDCAIKITAKHLGYTCDVHITSPAVREDPDPATDPPKVLDKNMCNQSLAEMRRAKWFDSKSKLSSALIVVVRCLRDLKRRIPTWQVFPVYVIELLCDKALRTVAHEMGPGELLRRFFELVSSGILLVGDNGVYDPCEKNNINACGEVDQQDCQASNESGKLPTEL